MAAQKNGRATPHPHRHLASLVSAGAAPPGARSTIDAAAGLAQVQRDVLQVARDMHYEGYSKHDALNARWLDRLAGGSRPARLVAIQAVMRSPIHIRPLIGVRRARNPKGLALFARALLARHRVLNDETSAREARDLLDWLVDHPSPGFAWPCWGYPYPWQDVGFFAPRDFPNRVVTSFVVHSLVDGFETLGDERYLDVASRAVNFLLEAPRTLYADERHRCVSYVPSPTVDWIVMDVPALSGAAAARVGAIRGDSTMLDEAGRLVRYVASKQTEYGAWYYAEPPGASHITHDNYHTGFILDALLGYREWARSDEFATTFQRGLQFYRERLFEPDGAPRFMHDRKYPFDIHGAAQGIITFALAHRYAGESAELSRRVLRWALDVMYDPESHWFAYQKRRFVRTRIRLLRWCQAWMAWAIGCHLEHCGELP
jgi:hypothetical protein